MGFLQKILFNLGMNMSNDQCPSFVIPELRNIPCGMLSSPQIGIYFDHGFLVKNPERNLLKGATYDMRLGTPAYRFSNEEKEEINLGLENDANKNIQKNLVLLPNSLTFVTTIEKFRLTRDVIARFNLKSKWIHKGLLLGTGPIVDPEFEDYLYIPIHNFSNKKVEIGFGKPLIVLEFTKTLNTTNNYIQNPKKIGKIEDYLANAGPVESSVASEVSKVNKDVENIKGQLNRDVDHIKKIAENSEEETKSTRKIGFIAGCVGLAGLYIGLIAIFISVYSMVSDLNTRMDSLHAIYNSNGIVDFKKISQEILDIRKALHIVELQKESIASIDGIIENSKMTDTELARIREQIDLLIIKQNDLKTQLRNIQNQKISP